MLLAASFAMAVFGGRPASAQGTNTALDRERAHIRECATGIDPGELRTVVERSPLGAAVAAAATAPRPATPPGSKSTFFSANAAANAGPTKTSLFVANGAETAYFNETVAIRAGPRKLCTGVLVAPDAVLTAGHCVCNLGLRDTSGRTKPYIVLGPKTDVDAQTPASDDKAWAYIDPARTQLFDKYFCEGMNSNPAYMQGRDLAVLFLDKDAKTLKTRWRNTSSDPEPKDESPVAIEAGRARMTLAPPDGVKEDDKQKASRELKQRDEETRGKKLPMQVYPAQIATPALMLSAQLSKMLVVGYGQPEAGKQVGPKRLACIPVASPICGTAQSSNTYKCAPGLETVLIDTVNVLRRDTCGGDSGGPIFAVRRTGASYRYYLVAVTSRAVSGSDCGAGGVYSLIRPRVVDWMRRIGVEIAADEFLDP